MAFGLPYRRVDPAAWLGKDLCGLETVIATGGVFAANPSEAGRIFEACLFDPAAPQHLLPKQPRKYVDTQYLLYAVGLLSEVAPQAALNLASHP